MSTVTARWLSVVLVIACGGSSGSEAAKTASASASNWHASTVDDANAAHVKIDPQKSWKDATSAIATAWDQCTDSVLVWGDLVVDSSVHSRAVVVSVGDKSVVSGFLICSAEMEPFLKLQTLNPRIKAGHGGSADLKWREGQLWMRRRWSAADIAMGKLDPPPGDVFQRGEALAALVSLEDPNASPADFLTAVARAPRVFVFAMLPLR